MKEGERRCKILLWTDNIHSVKLQQLLLKGAFDDFHLPQTAIKVDWCCNHIIIEMVAPPWWKTKQTRACCNQVFVQNVPTNENNLFASQAWRKGYKSGNWWDRSRCISISRVSVVGLTSSPSVSNCTSWTHDPLHHIGIWPVKHLCCRKVEFVCLAARTLLCGHAAPNRPALLVGLPLPDNR